MPTFHTYTIDVRVIETRRVVVSITNNVPESDSPASLERAYLAAQDTLNRRTYSGTLVSRDIECVDGSHNLIAEGED